MSNLPVRVVKVGCSLFERRQLPEQLRAWLQVQPPAIHVLLAGGGELADSIRTWDQRFRLGEADSHWLCIEALSITAQVLQKALQEYPLLLKFEELHERILALQSLSQQQTIIFDVQQFLRVEEPTAPPHPLPHGWQVTTDSIAARLAELLLADELVLLKSRPCPVAQDNLVVLAEQGFVDEYFPEIGSRVRRVRLCRLEP